MGGLFGGGSTTVNEENKVGSFQINQATYGATVSLVLGTTRISGNVIDWYDFAAIAHESRQHAGKGGGGSTVVNISYTYQVAVLIGLSEGKIDKVGRVWRDKELLSNISAAGFSLFLGEIGQAPWSYTMAKHPERALPYSGLAYVAGVVDLDSNGSLPQLNFEVQSIMGLSNDGLDVNPADACQFIITHPLQGIGFGSGNIDTASLKRFRTFCQAANLFISLPLTEQREAYQIIKDICEATNTIQFWSQGKLKFVPRCDERLEHNNVVFEPDIVPLYDLSEEDFLDLEDGKLLQFSREDSVDAYNHVSVEFINRSNQYKEELAEFKVQVDINRRGLRSAPKKELHYIHTKARAQYIASLLAMDSLYGRTTYKFRLGWSHCLLEPGDFVTLTEKSIGINKKPVIIDSIEEDEDGALEVIAKERPPGIYSPAKYQTSQETPRVGLDYNADPGSIAPPVIFEAPPALVDGGLELCVAVCGKNAVWGGANIWVSYDANTYRKIGMVTAPARVGKLARSIGAEKQAGPLVISLYDAQGRILSGTEQDADLKHTLCYVDGEWIAYAGAVLGEDNIYSLSGLRRGLYGSQLQKHAENTSFVRMDSNVFHYPFRVEDIGQKIYIKFTSFNVFGVGVQELDEVEPYSYTIRGASESLPQMSFSIVQNKEQLLVTLDRSFVDANYNSFFSYELRQGSSWEQSERIGVFTSSTYSFAATEEGTLTYWLKAINTNGIYAATASQCIVNVIDLPNRNILLERYVPVEACQITNMYPNNSGYSLQSQKLLKDYLRFFDAFNGMPLLRDDAYIELPVLDLGENIVDQGCYWVDESGIWHVKTKECLKDYNHFFSMFRSEVQYVSPSFALQTFARIGVSYEPKKNIRIEVEYRASVDSKVWDAWQPSSKNQFYGRYVQIRVRPISLDQVSNTTVKGVNVMIDVPDIEERITNVYIPAEKTRISFRLHYTESPSIGVFSQNEKGEQTTWRISNINTSGFDIELLDVQGNLIAGKLIQAIIRGY